MPPLPLNAVVEFQIFDGSAHYKKNCVSSYESRSSLQDNRIYLSIASTWTRIQVQKYTGTVNTVDKTLSLRFLVL